MGRKPCCDKIGLKRGPWSIEEDQKLTNFILNNGIHCWRQVPKFAGLLRCGKSCRLRWINYLRPDLKRGDFTEMEENHIIQLHACLGNKWSQIASHFPGRTDNEIKNHWNTRIRKKMKLLGMDPLTHMPIDKVEKEHEMLVPASGITPMRRLQEGVEVKSNVDVINKRHQEDKQSEVSSSLDDTFDLASFESFDKIVTSDEQNITTSESMSVDNLQVGFEPKSNDGPIDRDIPGRKEEKLSKISSSLDDNIDLINSYEFKCGGFQVDASVHMSQENNTSSSSSFSMEELNHFGIVDFNSTADDMLSWDAFSIQDDSIFFTNF